MPEDRISPSFDGKIIFITGGLGFVGKVLIEKLLRSMPNLGSIWLLVRSKRGINPHDRVVKMFQSILFDIIKKEYDLNFLLQKVRTISGDCSLPDLGLSIEDRTLIKYNVNIIYHCAATVRFDEPLKQTVLLNIRGTKLMIDLAKKCKKLEMFGYMGTAYCHFNENSLLEEEYPPPMDPYKLISDCECLDEEEIVRDTPKILKNYPNTYLFTKACAEGLVVKCMEDVPVVVYRLTLLNCCWSEPIPGWTDQINGLTGLLICCGKGIVRTLYCKPDAYINIGTVDYAVNSIITSTWNFIANKDHSKRIYNMVSPPDFIFTWQRIRNIVEKIGTDKLPINGAIWYPSCSLTSSRINFKIQNFLFHMIPAYVFDFILSLLGYKPIFKSIHKKIKLFNFFGLRKWDFHRTNLTFLEARLTKTEQEKFPTNVDAAKIEEYILTCVRGIRLYLLKQPDDTIPAAKRHIKFLWLIDIFFKMVFFVLIIFFIYFFIQKFFF